MGRVLMVTALTKNPQLNFLGPFQLVSVFLREILQKYVKTCHLRGNTAMWLTL